MSGNYHSRVFTFINNRTNRLKDTCAQGLRHLKLAVVWSSQILLYPLHLLAQATKIFQPQLPPPPQQRSLPQPVTDINIEQALDLVAGTGYPIVIAANGSLILDDPRSKILSQQVSTGKITTLINQNSWNIEADDPDPDDWEIASSSRGSHQVRASKPVIRGLSSLLIDRQLVLVTTENKILDVLTIPQQQEIRRRIGIDLATTWHQWHTNRLSNSHSHQQLSADRQLLLTAEDFPEQIVTDGNLRSLNLFDRWHNWLQSFQPKHSASPASIDRIKPKSPLQLPSAHYSFTPQPPTIDRAWDLPQLPPIIETQPTVNQDRLIQTSLSKLQPDWLKQWWNYYRDYLFIGFTNDNQIVHQPEEFKLIPLPNHPVATKLQSTQKQQLIDQAIELNSEQIGLKQARKKQIFIKQSSGELSKKTHQDLEYHQDWIEAESQEIGYSKSPIAKLLTWLDRVVLKIENWLIETWRAITNYPTQS